MKRASGFAASFSMVALVLSACGDDAATASSGADCTSMCGGSCSNAQTDANNCGVCGHSCLRGTCAGGACQPFMIATNLTRSGRILVGVNNNQPAAFFNDVAGVHAAYIEEQDTRPCWIDVEVGKASVMCIAK